MRYVDKASVEAEWGEEGEKDEEAEKVAVILLPHAVTHPRTMVVKPEQTIFQLVNLKPIGNYTVIYHSCYINQRYAVNLNHYSGCSDTIF